MFYHMFRLERDPETRKTLYDHTDVLLYNVKDAIISAAQQQSFYTPLHNTDGYWPSDNTWSVGETIETHSNSPALVSVVKSLEYIPMQDSSIVYVERLNYHTHKTWIPYRFRYTWSNKIKPASYNDRSLIHMRNLEEVFRFRTGIDDVQFTDPREAVLREICEFSSVQEDGNCTQVARNLAVELTRHPLDTIVTYDANATKTLQNEMSYLMRDLVKESPYDISTPKSPEQMVSHFLPLDCPPPLTRIICEGGRDDLIKNQSLMVRSPIDVSAVAPLAIRHPMVTLYSPIHAQLAGCWLNSTRGTDFDIVYFVDMFGHLVERQVNYFCDRYASVTNTNVWLRDNGYNSKAVHAFIHATRQWAFTENKDDIVWCLQGNFYVKVVKTFGEEALIELSKEYNGPPFHVVHFDLAILSLCSMGLHAELNPRSFY